MKKRRNLEALAFAVPALIILSLFVFYPLVRNMIYSFQSFTLSSVAKEWVGLKNYMTLFSDKLALFWNKLKKFYRNTQYMLSKNCPQFDI